MLVSHFYSEGAKLNFWLELHGAAFPGWEERRAMSASLV
jgi:hypothetical protein